MYGVADMSYEINFRSGENKRMSREKVSHRAESIHSASYPYQHGWKDISAFSMSGASHSTPGRLKNAAIHARKMLLLPSALLPLLRAGGRATRQARRLPVKDAPARMGRERRP